MLSYPKINTACSVGEWDCIRQLTLLGAEFHAPVVSTDGHKAPGGLTLASARIGTFGFIIRATVSVVSAWLFLAHYCFIRPPRTVVSGGLYVLL